MLRSRVTVGRAVGALIVLVLLEAGAAVSQSALLCHRVESAPENRLDIALPPECAAVGPAVARFTAVAPQNRGSALTAKSTQGYRSHIPIGTEESDGASHRFDALSAAPPPDAHALRFTATSRDFSTQRGYQVIRR